VHGWNDPVDWSGDDDPIGGDGTVSRPVPPTRHPFPDAGRRGAHEGRSPAESDFFAPGRGDGRGERARAGGTGPDDRRDLRRPGRHRRRHRRRGPLLLGVVVTALLGVLGVGAALLPPRLTAAPGDPAPEQRPAPGAAAPGQPDAALASPEAPTTVAAETVPTPTASTARPRPRPSATTRATPTRKTTGPAPRRTTATAPTRSSGGGDSREAQVLEIVNRERVANGCDPVVINSRLAEAARLHSQDQGEHTTMSHIGSDGSTFVERARRAGYDAPIGENVAMGYPTAAAVMEGWMNSPGHRANILNCEARAMGVGVATGADGRLYWTQMFGATP